MHAPIIPVKSLLAALAIATLAACAQRPPQANVVTPAAAADQATFSAPVMRISAFREGNRLNFRILQFSSATKHLEMTQVSADCSTGQGELIYQEMVRRLYPSSDDGLYNPPQLLNARQVGILRANPTFKLACSALKAPDWGQVSIAADGRQQYIDRANVEAAKALRQVWLLEDYPDEHTTLPYMAPVAQQRRRAMFDCAHQTVSLWGAYDLDARNHVTGFTPDTPLRFNVPMASAVEFRPAFDAVCGNPEALAHLPGYTARIKAPAQVRYLDVQPEPLAAVNRLALPAPRKQLHYLQIIGTVTSPSGTIAVDEEQFLSPDPGTGLLAISRRSDTRWATRESFRGLLDLVDETHYEGAPSWDITKGVTSVAFTGDWQHLPVGAQLGFQGEVVSLDSRHHFPGPYHISTLCTVQGESSAAQVNSQLSGQAKQLSCHWEHDAYKRVFTLQYLEDYGYFFLNHMDPNQSASYDRYLHIAQ